MKIMFRTLRNHGFDGSNRGGDGQVKRATVGGTLRRRIGTYAQQREMRELRRKGTGRARNARAWPHFVADEANKGLKGNIAEVLRVATFFLESVLGFKSEDKKQQVIRLADQEERWLIETLSGRYEEIKAMESLKEAAAKKAKADLLAEFLAIKPVNGELAMYGRFIASADIGELKVDAARFISHGISINEMDEEFDDIVAVDDLVNDGAVDKWLDPALDGVVDAQTRNNLKTKAGHLNHISASSDCIFTEGGVNVETLLRNLMGDEAKAIEEIKKYLTDAAIAFPRGRQASFFSRTPESYYSVEVLNYEYSLLNAFLAPVVPRDGKPLDLCGIEKLKSFRDKTHKSCEETRPVFLAERSVYDDEPKARGELIDEAVAYLVESEEWRKLVESVQADVGHRAPPPRSAKLPSPVAAKPSRRPRK